MTREEAVNLVISHGWNVWGWYKKRNGYSYQPFRKKNDYLWIGERFIEHSQIPHAVDFIEDSEAEVLQFICET